jgi:hypothetical protein
MMILICASCGVTSFDGEDIETCDHYTKRKIQNFIHYMRTREVELPLPDNKKLPKEMDCPCCYAKIKYPKYKCPICNIQVIFIEK